MNSGSITKSRIGRVTGRISRVFGTSTNFATASRFLRRQLWVWPLLAAVILGGSGWWVSHAVESALRDQRISDLNTIVNADVEALHVWMKEQRDYVDLAAKDETLLRYIDQLLAIAESNSQPSRELLQSQAQQAIRNRLMGLLSRGDYSGFFVVTLKGLVLAAGQDAPVGQTLDGYRLQFFDDVRARGSLVSKPYRSPLLLKDEKGELRSQLPTMLAAAAVEQNGKPVALLALRIRPEGEFSKIFTIARMGFSGETYAIDRNGRLLSNSRFDDDLRHLGLLADLDDSKSVLTVEARNPGVDMMKHERPAVRRAEQPLTVPAQGVSEGRDGTDADGYRDYRGVPSVGAWRYLKDYDFGVVTEIDTDEAFRPVTLLRRAFWVLMTLLALSAVAIFLAMLYITKQQKALQRATLAAKQLGQYSLETKLGTGGMGTVYKARHAMLRRPTAIKLLDVEKISDAAILRFEREVQLTAGLTHPNTIAVFDYGRTPEGIFYYAMEYLEGINLDDLVARHGPLPPGRALHLMKQICGSLAEAHSAGLVHRDIKPANVVLTIRGGLHDFVKVLDFGLAKTTESTDANLTSVNAITGTPLYLSPEAVNAPDKVDATSDVYALGAVAYFLLSGTPVFNGATVMEICMKHVQAAPEGLGKRMSQPLDPVFETLVMRCLAKSQADRPKHAGELLLMLEAITVGSWTDAAARSWWETQRTASPPTESPKTLSAAETTMAYDSTKPGAV